jgi:hypothetical protein
MSEEARIVGVVSSTDACRSQRHVHCKSRPAFLPSLKKLKSHKPASSAVNPEAMPDKQGGA